MPNERRLNSFRVDINTVLRPFDDERVYLQKLRLSATVEPILLRLFDLLQIEDYRVLFASIDMKNLDRQWLESFATLCTQRYLELDDIFLSTQPNVNPNYEPFSTTNFKSVVENYTNFLIENLKHSFAIRFFRAIIRELEELNRFKTEQIAKQLRENDRTIQQLLNLLADETDKTTSTPILNDDSIIHLSSTPAPPIINRPIYLHYQPTYMLYLRENLLIKNDLDPRLPSKGINNAFVADLINTKTINIIDETTGKTYDIPSKWIYLTKPCESNLLLPLKLRVLIIDSQTGRRRHGLIGEEPGKNNDYRCLIFFTDDPSDISASYHPSSHIHVCLDQTFSTHTLECHNEFINRYFASYPERMMLRAKEGTIVKVKNVFTNNDKQRTSTIMNNSNQFIPALVLQIDGSMMQIELSGNKQRIWLYRGSALLDQMHHYYSTQNKAATNGFSRHSARQHLSAKRSNAPEIICLNDHNSTLSNKIKLVRTVDQLTDGLDGARAIKRARVSTEQDAMKSSSSLMICSAHNGSRMLRPRQQNAHSSSSNNLIQTSIVSTSSSNDLLTSNSSNTPALYRQSSSSSTNSTTQPRGNAHLNANSKIIINPLFLELAEKFFPHHTAPFQPHYCSHKCVVYAEKRFHQLPRSINPFLKPFSCHWTILENIRVKKAGDVRLKTRSTLIYCAPCGRKFFSEAQVDNYLHATKSKLTIELFVFDSSVNLKQQYLPNGKLLNHDLSNGQENVPISVVNEIDKEPDKIEEPSAFTYRVERTPVEGVRMVTNEPTMTCCTCTDGCRNRAKCACWLRTLKYAELIGDERVKSMTAKRRSQADILNQLGYGYRRLHKNVPGGIYECNAKCSCNKQTCSNRVVQNGIIAQLQLFKTVGRGWGVRTLHDLPLGTFISVYSGEIFTSEQADERGKLLGDEYQADLDFFENINNDSEEEHSGGNLEVDEEDDDGEDTSQSSSESINTRLRNAHMQSRARELLNKKDAKKNSKSASSSDEHDNNSTLNRTQLPDYDGVVYTLDAKLVGNIGRYFNHSCSPNIAVQNVFVDTHDIHFPWIGFFATKTIRSGTELCWDYNYTVGEIAGRRMDCNCGSAECRRRVL